MKKVRTQINHARQNATIPIQPISANVSMTPAPQRDLTKDQPATALELVYLKGYTFAEASAALNLPLSTLLPMIRQEISSFKPPRL